MAIRQNGTAASPVLPERLGPKKGKKDRQQLDNPKPNRLMRAWQTLMYRSGDHFLRLPLRTKGDLSNYTYLPIL